MNQDSGFLTKDGKPSVFHFLDHHTTDAKYNKLYNLNKGHEHILTHVPFFTFFFCFRNAFGMYTQKGSLSM